MECKNCGKEIPKKRKFCSASCSATFNNKQRGKHSEETKKKISESLKGIGAITDYIEKTCPTCGNTFSLINISNKNRRNYCSSECRKIGSSKKLSKTMKERVSKGIHKGWQSRNILSYPEEFFINVLKNNNLYESCDTNHPFGGYFLDFYFSDLKLDLEIDGKQHQYRQEHDRIRDKFLTEQGIKVYRIPWKSINNESGKEYIKNEISNFLDFYHSLD